jgi:glycosyltransferase involved in cell wall biosynthesis
MRVLILSDRIPPESRGGAPEMAWRLALGLKHAGHEVHVVAATMKTAFEETREGIHTYHLHAHYPERWRSTLSLYNPQTVQPLRNLYARLRPDVVNAHNIHADLSYTALTIAHQMGIQTVFSSHDVMPFAYAKLTHFVQPDTCDIPPDAYRLPAFYNLKHFRFRYNPFRNLIIRHILSQHTRVRVAVSQELAHAHHANGLPPFSVVHNGIDSEQWQANPTHLSALRTRLNLENRKVILFGGRLSDGKGTQQLLSALKQVIPHVPHVALLVLSNKPLESQLSAQTLAEFSGHIISGGWLSGDELVSAYHLSDVVVAPSIIFDSFPNVNLEAMACAKPTIATCFGGGKEAVLDGQTGIVLNPFHTDTFANTLIRILSDETYAKQLGQAGYQRVTQHFSMQKFVNDMLQTYTTRLLT